MVPPETLALLRCPVDLAELRVERDLGGDGELSALVCTACARRYPIVNGLPDLVPPDADAYIAAARARGWKGSGKDPL
jgi:uncharacterized protein YbaR (Trm112 family)